MTCAQCGYDVAEGTACPRCGAWAAASTTRITNPSSWNPAGSPAGQAPPAPPGPPSWTPAGGPGGNPQAPPPGPPSWTPAADPAGYPAGGPAGYPAGGPAGYPPPAPPGPPSWNPAGGPAGHPPSASSGFKFDLRRWTRSDKIAGGASLLVLISLFLPWFSGSVSSDNGLGIAAQTGSESGTSAHGWLWLVFVLVLAVLAYLVLVAGFQVLPFKSPLRHDQLLLVVTGVDLLLVLIGFLLKPSTDGIAGVSIGWSIGAFLALVAAIVAVAAVTPPGRERLDSGARAAQ